MARKGLGGGVSILSLSSTSRIVPLQHVDPGLPDLLKKGINQDI